MNIKDYFWDLSEEALKEAGQILKNPSHPDFLKKIIRVLARNDQPGDVFTLITKEQFTEIWPRIRREWKRTNEAPDHLAWWETIYEQLLDQKKGKNQRFKGAPAKESREIGYRIRLAREGKGWSQIDLARHVGLKQPDISAIEKGKINSTLATLSKFEKILDMKEPSESPKQKEPEPAVEMRRDFQLDGIQKLVYEALKELAGPGAEAFYWDACWLRKNAGDLQSRSHLLGHLFREIESSVRDVLRLCLGVIKETSHKSDIEKILKQLSVPQDVLPARTWFKLAEQGTLHGLAHRAGLSQPRAFSEDMQFEFWKFDAFLNWILCEVRKHSEKFIQQVDNLLSKDNPTPTDAEMLCDTIPNTYYIRKYFFERCSNSKWLILLKNKGIFQSPPEPQQNEEGYVSFPLWAESGYLMRMAKEAPEEVADIILSIPDTQNVQIIDELVKAALNMPIAIAAKMLEKAAKWVACQYMVYPLDEHISELIITLYSAGRVNEALKLMEILLEILPDPQWQEKNINGDFQWDSPYPKARVEEYRYKEIADKIIPELEKSAGIPIFQWLCEQLDKSLEYSRVKDGEAKNKSDYSSIWRPEIEKPTEYEKYELKNILIDLILKTKLVSTIGINTLIAIISEKPWMVFKRIALYLLSRQPGLERELVEKYLCDRTLFLSRECWDEYGLLLGKGFGLLSQDRKNLILKWIEEGPDFDEWGRKPEKDEIEQTRQIWQRDRMAGFGQSLPEAWQPKYSELVGKYGEPEKSVNRGVEVDCGWETSPKTMEELAVLPVEVLVRFLNEWRPSVEARDVSAEGLSRVVSSLIKARPEVYSAEAQRFTQLTSPYSSNYVFWILWGFEEVLRSTSVQVEWMPLLEFCQWLVKQPLETAGDNAADWAQSKGEAANVLGEGMRKNIIPLKLRKSVWSVLESITKDHNPTSYYEKTINQEPHSLSINSTRGKAMHAVMQYIWWLHQNNKIDQTIEPEEEISRETLSRIEKVLERHLDHAQEDTLAIHSVYGQWFPWLAVAMPNWINRNLNKIFPPDKSENEYWDAAWNAYILFCRPYDDVFQMMRKEYARAVDGIEEVASKNDERLAWHLMLYYIRGKLELESDVFMNFWKQASDELRGKAIYHIGFNILKNAKDRLPDQAMQRLKTLWDKRQEVVLSASTPMAFSKEMAAFGYWFSSGQFEHKWAIEQLLFVLETTKHVETIPTIVDQLKTMAEIYPVEVVRILQALVENETYFIALNQDKIMNILENVWCVNNEEGKKKALDFCNYLISKGYLKFQDVLRVYEEQLRTR